ADDRERATRVDQRAHADGLIDVLAGAKRLRVGSRDVRRGGRHGMTAQERGQGQQARSASQLTTAQWGHDQSTAMTSISTSGLPAEMVLLKSGVLSGFLPLR